MDSHGHQHYVLCAFSLFCHFLKLGDRLDNSDLLPTYTDFHQMSLHSFLDPKTQLHHILLRLKLLLSQIS